MRNASKISISLLFLSLGTLFGTALVKFVELIAAKPALVADAGTSDGGAGSGGGGFGGSADAGAAGVAGIHNVSTAVPPPQPSPKPQVAAVGAVDKDTLQQLGDLASQAEEHSVLLKADLRRFEKANTHSRALHSLFRSKLAIVTKTAAQFNLTLSCFVENVRTAEQEKECRKQVWAIDPEGRVLLAR